MRAFRLEVTIPRMFERALTVALKPLRVFIDALTMRIDMCERGQKDTHKVTALKVAIVDSFYMPPATTGDEVRIDDAAAESEAETDEEQLGVQEEIVFEGLTDLEEAMVHFVVQASLTDTIMACSSATTIDETKSTDAPTDGATEMQTSPMLSLAR
uniref:Polyprotein protein n=1 Tax=Solanum tuberosum TaxID=4113 RepID=M1DPQ6_SOLTU